MSHPQFKSGQDIVIVLTDQRLSKTFFGEKIYFRSRSGVRYVDAGSQEVQTGENHRDICLATFAELGLPLSTPVEAVDGSFTTDDLLRDSVENFDIMGKELEWTSVAYVLYLTRERKWTNRYHESFTFDDLAKALMRSSLKDKSCGGVHLLYAMTVLLRATSSSTCLSERVQDDLYQYLKQKMEAAIRSQDKAGSWALDWHAVAEARSEAERNRVQYSERAKLLATGHVLEWLELLPGELQPSPDLYRRAACWVGARLEKTHPIKSMEDFCPSVHAACALQKLIGEIVE